jgi:hypothetical protein
MAFHLPNPYQEQTAITQVGARAGLHDMPKTKYGATDFAETGAKILKAVSDWQDEIDTTNVQAAVNESKIKLNNLKDNPEDGWANQLGTNALDRPDGQSLQQEYLGRWNAIAKEQRGKLKTARAQAAYDKFATEQTFALRQNLDAHVIKQQIAKSQAEDMQSMQLAAQDMTSGDWKAAQSASVAMDALIQRQADKQGLPVDQWKIKGEAHVAAVQGFIDNNSPDLAAKWYAQYREEMSPKQRTDANRLILGAALDAKNYSGASAFLKKHGGDLSAKERAKTKDTIYKVRAAQSGKVKGAELGEFFDPESRTSLEDLHELRKRAEAIKDPVEKRAALNELNGVVKRKLAELQETIAIDAQAGWNEAQENGELSPSLEARMERTGNKALAKIRAYLENMNNPHRKPDPKAMRYLNYLRYNDRQEFLRVTATPEYAPYLTDAQWKDVQQLRKQVNDERFNKLEAAMRKVIKKEKVSVEQENRIIQGARSSLQLMIDQGDGKISEEQIFQIAQNSVEKVVSKKNQFWVDDKDYAGSQVTLTGGAYEYQSKNAPNLAWGNNPTEPARKAMLAFSGAGGDPSKATDRQRKAFNVYALYRTVPPNLFNAVRLAMTKKYGYTPPPEVIQLACLSQIVKNNF